MINQSLIIERSITYKNKFVQASLFKIMTDAVADYVYHLK